MGSKSGFKGLSVIAACSQDRLARAQRHLGTHQDANLVKRPPFFAESQKAANLEIACGDVKRLRDAGPLEIAERSPHRHAVVDDEKIAASGCESSRSIEQF
jgi:hypothetical protein